jgi:hypothetical protein
MRFVVDEMELEQFLFQCHRLFPAKYHSTIALFIYHHPLRCAIALTGSTLSNPWSLRCGLYISDSVLGWLHSREVLSLNN